MVATTGWVTNRDQPLCSPASSHSRGPGGLPLPAEGNARRANVVGAPSTSRMGTSIDNSMCAAMCMLNIAGMYRPSPDDVVNNSSPQPSSQAVVRPAGQSSPRRRNLTAPAT